MVSKGGGEQGCKLSRGRIREARRGIFLVNYKFKKVVLGFSCFKPKHASNFLSNHCIII